MLNKGKTIIIVEVIMVLLAITIFGTMAYLSIGGKQDLANNFTSGCLNITLNDVNGALTLNNAFPITDIEGLEQEKSYEFKIKNTCDSETSYKINLESMKIDGENELDPKYVKVALSSDDMDNIIKKLESEDIEIAHLADSKQSNNLYRGVLKSQEEKIFTLKEWMDYDTTKEQGAGKVFQSKIYVVSDSREEITEIPKIQLEIDGGNLKGTISGEAQEIKYCITSNNICTPNETVEKVDNNSISIKYPYNGGKKIVCTSLDGKTMCSDPISPSEVTLAKLGLHSQGKIGDITGTACGGSCDIQDENGIYEAEDDYGTSYFFRGTVNNNWVQFGALGGDSSQPIYWRIIRINGDGSIRLIISSSGTDTSSMVAFNKKTDFNAYVGYTYGTPNSIYFDEEHIGTNKSHALEILNEWYNNNLFYAKDYLSESTGFCGDRDIVPTAWTGLVGKGYGNQGTSYGPASRLYENSQKKSIVIPSLKCPNKERDLYTTTSSSNGNKKLENPIGLITSDEVIFAGGFTEKENQNFWLIEGNTTWTMSPSLFNGTQAAVFGLNNEGLLYGWYVEDNSKFSVRAVINLKAESNFSFNNPGEANAGTIANPYIWSGISG